MALKNDDEKLLFIKVLHTAIWVFFNVVLIYLYYVVITDRIDLFFWLGTGAFGVEILVLLIYRWNCPLTFAARKYSDSNLENFDIFIPLWIARHNKTIYSILLVILMIIFIFNQFNA